MVHLGGGVADTAGLGRTIFENKPKSPFRAALTRHLIVLAVVLVDMMDSTTNKRKAHKLGSEIRAGRWLRVRRLWKNWAGVDIMYYLDEMAQSLVYFGEP